MATQTDPVRPAIVDENENNSSVLPLPEELNGFNDDQILTAKKFNAINRANGLFTRWLDQNSMRIELAQGSTVTCRLSATSLRFAAGAGLQQPVSTAGHYIIEGRLVQHTVARCESRGQSPHLFTAFKDTHLWLKADGSIRFEAVDNGDPSGGALPGEYYEGYIETDGVSVQYHIGPGDPFFTAGWDFDTPRNLVEAVTAYRGDVLRVEKAVGSSSFLRFEETFDTPPGDSLADNGWYFECYNSPARRLRIRQRVGGSDATIVDFGDVNLHVPMATTVPLWIGSTETAGGDFGFYMACSDITGPGGKFQTLRTAACTFEATDVGGVPIVMVPRSGSFVGGAAKGSIQITSDADSDIQYKDNNNTTRYVVAPSRGRRHWATQYMAALAAIAAATTAASVNFDIVNGATYRINMCARVGRVAASTRDAQMTCSVGGLGLPPSAHIVAMFQAGAANQLEQTWHSGEMWYVATVTGSVIIQFTIAPINGAGNINIALRSVSIEGPFD